MKTRIIQLEIRLREDDELEIRQQISEDPLRWDLRPGTQAKDVPNYLVTEYLKQMLDFGLEHSLREGR